VCRVRRWLLQLRRAFLSRLSDPSSHLFPVVFFCTDDSFTRKTGGCNSAEYECGDGELGVATALELRLSSQSNGQCLSSFPLSPFLELH
jgi:hypothetical protein